MAPFLIAADEQHLLSVNEPPRHLMSVVTWSFSS